MGIGGRSKCSGRPSLPLLGVIGGNYQTTGMAKFVGSA